MRKIALFDQPLPYKLEKAWSNWIAYFTTPNGQKAQVSIYKDYADKIKTDQGVAKVSPKPVRMGIVFFVGDLTQMTGKGESVTILSTVISICREVLAKERATEEGRMSIRFDAKGTESGRASLYNKLAHGLSREFDGDISVDTRGDKVYYEIRLPATREEIITPVEPR